MAAFENHHVLALLCHEDKRDGVPVKLQYIYSVPAGRVVFAH
jgi:hypothetical protein